MIAVLFISSKGAVGVTGSGFLVLTSTLAALKIISLEGLALLIGIDRFMSEGRAIVNVIGNSVATVVIAKSEKSVNIQQYQYVVEKKGTMPASMKLTIRESRQPLTIYIWKGEPPKQQLTKK